MSTARKLAKKQRDSKMPVSPQLQARVQELSQWLAGAPAGALRSAGNKETLASSILEPGIGRKSFTVTVTAAASTKGQQHEYYTVGVHIDRCAVLQPLWQEVGAS